MIDRSAMSGFPIVLAAASLSSPAIVVQVGVYVEIHKALTGDLAGPTAPYLWGSLD